MTKVVPLTERLTPSVEWFRYGFSIHIYGNAPWWRFPEQREWYARTHTPNPDTATLITVAPPSPHNGHKGRHSVVAPQSGGMYQAEGVHLLTPNSVGITWTRDCHALVVFNRATRALGVAHVGRDSLLSQPKCDGCTAGIVSNLLQQVCPLPDRRNEVLAIYGGGICQYHFAHQDPTALAAIARYYPSAVSGLGPYRLDIPEVIKLQLTERGVKLSNLQYWQTCSYEDETLGSKRAEDAGIADKRHQNVWMVVRRH